MRELIVPPLIVNLIMFIVGLVYGINPNFVTSEIVISNPGGYVFQFTLSAIFFGLISAIIGVALLIGIRALGSGIADASGSMVLRALIYSMVWTLLSTMTFGFLSLVPTFGLPLYSILSIMYAIGVMLSLGEMDSVASKIQKEGGTE